MSGCWVCPDLYYDILFKGMNELNRSHEQASEFFASKSYRSFEEQMGHHGLNPRNFNEMSLKCCGYGYFPEFKDKMKQNFLEYLREVVKACPDLTTLKVIFNGFDISDHSLKRIIDSLKGVVGSGAIRNIHLLTTNLRNCHFDDF